MEFEAEVADRAAFVTGADGFIGSHLTEVLLDNGADVHAFVRATSSGRLQNIAAIADDVTLHRGDLRDPRSVREALSTLVGYSDSLVFHLAAQAHVGESWDRPYETVEANVNGTLNLLQSIVDLDLDIAKFDTAGTSEEYGNVRADMVDKHEYETGNRDRVIMSERSPVNPKSVYATTKLAADFLTMNYHDAYGLPTVTTRMFNNYGPRQNPRYITGTVITQALEREVVELGNLEPKRDMCYVTDGVRGHLHAALGGKAGEQYVYGYGENISMRDWADLILEVGREHGHWDERQIVQDEARYRPGDSDVEELRVGYDKLHEETGWKPTVDWREGIGRTIAWYADNRAGWIGQVDWR